jgi:glycosyltransferase involved in cell wall biosynthesis
MARAVDTFRRAADERAAQEAQASAEQKEVADALGQVLRTMAAGDLRGGAALRFPESYAAVNRDLNDAVDTLRSMVQAVVETTTEIGGASDSIARATGGLRDTIIQYEEKTGFGTGFLYYQGTPAAISDTVGWAVSTYYDRPHHMDLMRKRAMVQHFSWADAAKQYENVYQKALLRRETWQ